ncbi:MAG TPA: pitrilysin family protein [Jatrophihabitantaceae bacterium]|nr:pitrilysin family protein [Jatrophihabitantaceae bacterium]
MSAPALNASVPALGTARRPRKFTALERTLDSGLRVVVVRKPGVPLVEVRLRVPFLSARAAHAARATVLSDSVLTGTVDHDRAGLAAAVQRLGGDLGIGVDADRLQVSGNVLATNLRGFLDVVADVLTGATYPAKEVVAERERLVERLTIARSRAGVVAGEALARRMWGDHPYARDLPEPEDVQAVTAAQVRRLHGDLVRPDGAVLVIVGDVSAARAADLVAKTLDGWAGGAAAATRVPPLPAVEPGPLVLVDRPGSVQSSLRLGASALRRDDERYPALQLANLIFGGYFSSRWTENIREDKGYTYGPHSGIDHHALGSTLQLQADVATEVTGPALLETLYELGRLASLPPSTDEVESARQYAIGTLALSTATQSGLASTLSSLAGVGLGPDWLAEHPRRLAKVTRDEIAAAAAEFLAPSRFATVVVGDAASVRGPLAALTPVV